MQACALEPAFRYVRHRPEETPLYQCLREHLAPFLAGTAEGDRVVPGFVQRELEAYLDCGILERGCLRVRCPECGFDRLVGFSCKGRAGICPSCGARRMAELAAHLCDHVLPEVPFRQWVLSVPHPVRYLLAYDASLMSAVIGLFVRAIFNHLGLVAKREGLVTRLSDAPAGAICVPQRYGSAANLNPHLHVLATDGVYVVDEAGKPVFRALPAPSRNEVIEVASRVCERTVDLLRAQGRWVDADAAEDDFAQREPMLAGLYAASIAGRLVTGPNAGMRPMRLFGAAAREDRHEEDVAHPRNTYGFDLHAGVRVSAHDRAHLERLCRYLVRPALSNDWVQRLEDGRYSVPLKTPWRDGTSHIVLTAVELVARLAALVPAPRVHLVRYHGVFAPRSKLRALVVPKPDDDGSCAHGDGASRSPSASRSSWARLMKRVFALDVLECPRCQARMQHIAELHDAKTIREVVTAITRSTGPP